MNDDTPGDLTSQRPDLAFLAENQHAHLPNKPPAFGVEAPAGSMRGYFENREGEQWVAMANPSVLHVSGSCGGREVLTVELSSGRTLAMLRDGLAVWSSAWAECPVDWPKMKMWFLDRTERTWLLAFLDAASARFDRSIEPGDRHRPAR
jgi:hypothetical protein